MSDACSFKTVRSEFFLLWSVVLCVFEPVSAAPFIRGDANGSGSVDMSDAISIFQHLFLGMPTSFACADAADANDADGLDISDGIYLLVYLFDGGAPPPRPFPLCGLDSLRVDGLDCALHKPCEPPEPPSCFATVNGMVDVGGYSLFAKSAGQTCPLTVVFDAGLGNTGQAGWENTSFPFFSTLAAIAKENLSLVYDRAGLGSSDRGPTPRAAEQMMTELHALLGNAGFEPPYVLVGHSMGGYNIRVFANKYPGEVAGMVFVEPSLEDFWNRFSAELPAEFEQYLQAEGDAFANASSGARLELEAFKVQRFLAPGPIPDVPIAVLTGLRDISAGWGVFPPEVATALAQLWDEAHEALARSVTDGVHFTDPFSGHYIQEDNAMLVVKTIREVIEKARGR